MRERGDRDGLREPGEVLDGHADDGRPPRERVQRHGGGPEERAEEQRGGVEPQRPRLHRRFRRALLLLTTTLLAAAAARALRGGDQQQEARDGHRDGELRRAGGRGHLAAVMVVAREDGARADGEREGELPAQEEDGGEDDEERRVHCRS
ncbi:hypothetical protein U9M48_038653 [Paspalum notatum var. saurae]|uniref:Uncharacterized protein n=1 Tax=Paspalum notatum var. saurae TaxID=547442 RepID=A0AAQ3UNN0_PASNO